MSYQEKHIIGQFYEYTIRDIPMIVKKINDNKFDINYTKLINKICLSKGYSKDNAYHAFRNFIITNNFINHIIYYFETHDIQYNLNDNYKFTSVPDFCEKTNGLFYQETKVSNEIKGTYGPYEFIDIILVTFDPHYAANVHKIMDKIDKNARLHNQTFKDELDETLYKLEQIESKLENYEIDYDEYNEYKELKDEIENHEYEFNPSVNLILTSKIDQLQKIQRDLRIYSAYAHYIERRNQTKFEKIVKPKWKDLILILDPMFDPNKFEKLTNNQAEKIVYDLAYKNNDEIEAFIINDILRIKESLN